VDKLISELFKNGKKEVLKATLKSKLCSLVPRAKVSSLIPYIFSPQDESTEFFFRGKKISEAGIVSSGDRGCQMA
jgi:hypothetical protein